MLTIAGSSKLPIVEFAHEVAVRRAEAGVVIIEEHLAGLGPAFVVSAHGKRLAGIAGFVYKSTQVLVMIKVAGVTLVRKGVKVSVVVFKRFVV